MPDIVGLEEHKRTSLRGIANKAKADKQHCFGNLYGELDEAYLRACWPLLNKQAASGVDGVAAQEYAEQLEANIQDLVDRLKAGRYRARLVRRHYIPKANGKLRPLGIPVVEDKLLQAACAQLLQAIYEQDFLPYSFGYRPERGAKDAVRALTFNLQYGCFGYIVEADIKGFFDNLDHEWLLKMLRRRIQDEAFIGLIRKWLKAGVLEPEGEVIHPVTGSPQGGIVSPILANVYLHYALDLWFEHVVKPHCKGKALLCRYCDDFVCAFQYREDAEAFYRVLPKRLAKFNLEVAPEKTRILRFSRFHPSHKRGFTFLGFEFIWAKDRKGLPRVKKRTAPDKLQGSLRSFAEWVKRHRHYPLHWIMEQVRVKLRGYYNYYGVHGNALWLKVFYVQAMEMLYKWLNRRSQRKSMNRRRFYRVLDSLRIPRPRITERWGGPNRVLA